jgi:hypothetical protein
LVKAANGRYRPGQRGWFKRKKRTASRSATSPHQSPHVVMLGHHISFYLFNHTNERPQRWRRSIQAATAEGGP